MADHPSISVIIPAYNHQAFISEAINSVLTQSFSDWELIVVDDGSTDQTLATAHRFSDPRIRVYSQENSGSHAAINRGISLARGRYLALLNSDDRYPPGRLQRLAALAEERGEGHIFAATGVTLVDGDGQAVADPGHPWLQMYAGILAAYREAAHPLLALLWGNFTVSSSNFFMDRALVEQVGLLRPYRYVLDWEFALRVALRCPQAFVFLADEALLDYRLHGANTILGGAVRNHLEAARMLRSALVGHFGPTLKRPLLRIRYLERFIRQRECYNREHAYNLLSVEAAKQRNELESAANALRHLEGVAESKDAELAYRGEVLAQAEARLQIAEGELAQREDKLAQTQAWAQLLESELAQRVDTLAQTQAQLQTVEGELAQREDKLAQTQAWLATVESELAQREDKLAQTLAWAQLQEHEAARQAAALNDARYRLWDMQRSTSWRATAPLRALGRQAVRLRQLKQAAQQLRARQISWGTLLRRGAAILLYEGLNGLRGRVGQTLALAAERPAPAAGVPPAPASRLCTAAYAAWLAEESAYLERLRGQAPQLLAALPNRPRFSLVVPVFNTDPAMLDALFASVRAQLYPDWELCLCDDASSLPATREALAAHAGRDGRVKVAALAENGHIAVATNAALALAEGDYAVFIDHDDELAPHALLRLAQTLAAAPDIDVVYSDEDKLDEQGLRCLPYFKPDWSPTLLLAQNYLGHLVCVRLALLREAGGVNAGTEGAQDYDLALRLSERTARIHHLPEVLYHWRLHAESTAANAGSKPYAHEAGRKAVENHLRRRYPALAARVDDGEHLFVYDPRFPVPPGASASIIIPTKDKAELLEACVDSLLARTAWPHFEILILDNQSSEAQTFAYFERIAGRDKRLRVVPAPIPFNWSRLNNIGAREARGEVLVFLNNDTEVISPDWLERLMEHALLPDVGTVGAQLLYPDGTVQHAGVVVGMGGWADHVYKGAPPAHYPSPFIPATLPRNVLANTGACMAIERAKFERLGGFDEAFEICGSDVEMGLRAHRQGLLNVYLATAKLYHLESKTRSSFVPEVDFVQSELKYAPYRRQGDPFYNPNLSPMASTPTPKFPADLATAPALPATAAQEARQAQKDAAGLPTQPSVDIPELTALQGRSSGIDRPRLNLLLPSLQPQHLFGGILTAVQFFLALAGGDADARIILTEQSEPPAGPPPLAGDWTVADADADDRPGRLVVPFGDRAFRSLPVGRGDVFVATAWWTAYVAQRLLPWQAQTYGQALKPLVYLIQDYEPGFYPCSSRQMLARSTYDYAGPMVGVFNTGLLRDYFAAQGHRLAREYVFEPQLNPVLARYRETLGHFSKRRQLIVYGRPGMPRNAFELVCQGVRHWTKTDPSAADWSIYSIGEAHPDVALENGLKLASLGKLSLDEYARILAESAIGVSLMFSPHPSYPPLEMAEFGVQTITNRYANKDLGQLSEHLHSLRTATPESIGEQIHRLAQPFQSAERIDVPLPRASLFSAAAEAFPFIAQLRAELAGGSEALGPAPEAAASKPARAQRRRRGQKPKQ